MNFSAIHYPNRVLARVCLHFSREQELVTVLKEFMASEGAFSHEAILKAVTAEKGKKRDSL
jgi:hypothetical protein